MAEVIRQYIEHYILSKIREIPKNDPLYKEYQEAKKLLAKHLSKEIANRIIEGKIFFNNIEQIIYDILSEKIRNRLLYIPNNLEDLLSIAAALEALKLKGRKVEERIEETKEDLNREHLEYIRKAGLLVNTGNPLYKRFYEVSYKSSSYLIPIVKNKEELLTVLAAIPPSRVERIVNHSVGWIRNDPKLFSIVQKYSKDPCSLLEEYPEIIKPLYILGFVINESLREYIEHAKKIRNIKVRRFNEIWNIIERKIREDSKHVSASYKCKNNIDLIILWSDVFKLREISNNIIFWYNLYEKCKNKIYEYLDKECVEKRNDILKEREARMDY